MKRVGVIGGGAAGLAAAISAAQRGAQVTIYEASDRVGTKILSTGNGRCNLTNMQVGPAAYNAPAFVEPTLKRYGADRIRAFFQQLGLMTVEEREGRVYPLSNAANSVLDVLRLTCERLNVQVVTNCQVDTVQRADGGFVIGGARDGKGRSARPEDRMRFVADSLVVATGGGSKALMECGHTFTQFEPVLCSLATDSDMFRGLSGVRVHAQVNAFDAPSASAMRAARQNGTDALSQAKPFASEYGEVLFRDYGLSGIVIFDLSRVVEYGNILSVDLLPDVSLAELTMTLNRRLDSLEATQEAHEPTFSDLMCGMFHPRMNTCVLRAARCKPSAVAERDKVATIAQTCKDLRTTVKGVGDKKHAQVTRGGARLEEFDPQTLASRKVPGVFAAGETLNIDGRCGGYNLHWAWASGIVAGIAAAR